MSQNVKTDPYAPIEAALDQHKTRLESDHSEMMEVVERIRSSLGTLAEKAGAEVRFAEELRDQARAQLQSYRETSSADSDSVNHLSARIETLEAELAARHAELAEARTKLEDYEAGNDPDELKNIQAKYEKAKQHIERIERALKEQGDANEANQASKWKIAQLETTVSEYSEAAKADQERAAELQRKIEALTESEGALSRELEEARRFAEEQGSAAASTKQVADAAQQELNAKRDEIATLVEEQTKRESELSQSNKGNLELKSRIKELEEANAILKTDAEKASAQTSELETANAKLTDDLESVRSRARETAESERTKAQSLEKAETTIKELQTQVDELASLEERSAEWEADRKEAAGRIAELEEELRSERAGGTKSMLANELAQALKERDEARAQLRQLRSAAPEAPGPTPSAPESAKAAVIDDDKPVQIRDTSRDRRLGEVLLDSGLITKDDLDEVLRLQESEKPNEHIGAILVEMGAAKEDTVAQALAFQSGLEFVRLRDGAVHKGAPDILNRRVAERHHCLPLRVEGGALVLAMENPLDLIAIEDVERASEMPVRVAVSTRSDLAAAIARHYGSSVG